MNLAVVGIIELFLLAFAWFRPQFMDATLPFGVRVPPEQTANPAVKVVLRGYRAGILIALVVLVLLAAARWSDTAGAAFPLVSLATLVVLLLADYEVAHYRMRAIKAAQNWYAGQQQAVAAAVGDAGADGLPSPLWALPALLMLAATALIGILRYPGLPAQIAVHFAAGVPDRWVPRQWSTVLMPVWQSLSVTVILGLLAWAAGHLRREVDPADPVTSTFRQNRFRRATFKLLWGVAAIVNLFGLMVGLVTWQMLPMPNVTLVTLAPALLVLIVVGGFVWRIGQGGSRVPAPTGPAPKRQEVARDDDRFWKGGVIYFNTGDPAIFVQKRFSVGMTLNFGHPAAWGLILLLIAFIVARRYFFHR